MMHVLYQEGIGFWNVDNEEDLTNALKNGARELTDDEKLRAGMIGHEHEVSPNNTTINEKGVIVFTCPEGPSLEEVKAAKIKEIDEYTSACILAGFEHEVVAPDTGELESLHFSYDILDQQNFSDSAISANIKNVDSIPKSISWNAYRNHTSTYKGDLVVLTLTAETFLPIYGAALNHKATIMEKGSQRKAEVQSAQTIEEVNRI